MARPSNTDERRAQIARGLLRVMAREGYDGASIARVARAAKVAPGIVHYHFRDKREILLLAMEELTARHRARLEERLAAAEGEPARELEAFLDLHLGLGADSDPEALACWVLMGAEALRHAKIRERFEKVALGLEERLAAILREGTARGAFHCAEPEQAAAGIFALIHGYFALAASARAAIPRGSAVGTARRMVQGLLSGAPSPRGPRR
jgi:TetR/AcrR family transcriptional regulator, transcriptional repressor of bet genes